MKCLAGLVLPDDLPDLGCEIGETERILPTAITAMVVTEGSTVPIRVTQAGIVKVRRYLFALSSASASLPRAFSSSTVRSNRTRRPSPERYALAGRRVRKANYGRTQRRDASQINTLERS
jgi:hypothetical protein